uniref:protein O-GlcNAc transferase n=1 Tax=Bicosoecida sp. CB-2014 TaxID=1486930 RepID=A0A7S1G9A1_9STRA
MASVLLQQGHNEEALVHFEHAVRLRPDNACWQVDLGHLYRLFGHIDRAEACFLAAIRLSPTFPIAWSNMACILKDKGNVPEAIRHYRRAIELDPACVAAHSNLGNVLKDSGQLKDAAAEYEAALKLGGDNAVILANLAATQLELGMLEPSLATFDRALALQPDFPDALSNRGNAYKLLGRTEDAVRSYEAALRSDPDHPDALNNLANTYRDMGRAREAEDMYRHAIRVRPHFAGAHSNLGNLLKEQHKMHEALAEYQLAISYDPTFTNAYSNMGNTLKDLGRFPEAVAAYLKAIELQPSFADAYANLASVYKDSGRVEEAIATYRQALSMKEAAGLPTDPIAWCNLVHTLQTVCDWRDRDAIFQRTWELIHEQMARHEVPAVQPHHALAYPFSAAKQLEIAQHYAQAPLRNVLSLGLHPYEYDPVALAKRLSLARGRRLRLGYVSSDFGNHPLAHLMQHVFLWHDRSEFEVFCMATSPSDGSQWRMAVQTGVEHFVDASALSHGDLAALIHDQEIDILVNLNGYTKGSRNDVFALQPAPVQIMYMGFPGSSGATYHQYFVTDRIASPPELAHLFTERLAYMPHCYFVNDHAQSYADAVGRLAEPDDATVNAIRARYGLPPRPTVVYCMFNQLYKIAPDVFDVWMAILKAVPDSVLWLLTFPESGKANIVNEAVRRGVDASRLVFSPVANKHEHISRGRAADLFLDTTQCNAHTTATDILWAGTPLITCPGETLASRVASSIVAALDCPELIAASLDDYQERAIAFGQDVAALRRLQAKVQGNRTTTPLFNTRKWVHDFDRLLRGMAADHRARILGESVPDVVEIEAERFGDETVTLAPPAAPPTAPMPVGVQSYVMPAAPPLAPATAVPVAAAAAAGGALQPAGVVPTPTALAPMYGIGSVDPFAAPSFAAR